LAPRDILTNHYKSVDEEFNHLTELFNQIDVTANLITTLYGAPTDDYQTLLNLLNADSSLTFEEVSDESIFKLYGNLNLSDPKIFANMLATGDVENFRELGTTNIEKVVETIKELNTTIASLDVDYQTLTEIKAEELSADIQSLKEWYGATLSNIEQVYNTWESNVANELVIKNWNEYNSQMVELYVGDSAELYEKISELVTSTSTASDSIAQAARTITDNSSEFDNLVTNVLTVQEEAQKALNNADSLVNTGSLDLSASKEYYDNFSKLLSNTRTQGVDTNNIYDFFVKPIATEDISPKVKAVVVKNFDFRWLIVFLIGLLVGMLSILGWYRFSMRKREV
ncbi:hypothetical protein, partial [Pseudolactococcus hodotermopsidis]|uniref:hypothetical protein n=1 Tax=Pseudolactococcus hodotermopsidis TaxID=2709157 RepID=UPI001E2F5AFC